LHVQRFRSRGGDTQTTVLTVADPEHGDAYSEVLFPAVPLSGGEPALHSGAQEKRRSNRAHAAELPHLALVGVGAAHHGVRGVGGGHNLERAVGGSGQHSGKLGVFKKLCAGALTLLFGSHKQNHRIRIQRCGARGLVIEHKVCHVLCLTLPRTPYNPQGSFFSRAKRLGINGGSFP